MRGVIGGLSLLWKIYIAIIFGITAIIFYPFIAPLLFSEKTKKKSFIFFVCWSWVFRIFCLYFVRKVEKNKLPQGPYLIIANHSSYLDIFLMYSILPKQPFLFLGKSEILKYPLIKTYFKRLNIPVFRGDRIKSARSFIMANREVKKGWSLVIFPEGGIPDYNNPKMIEFKDGAFQLAKACKIPIVPVTFTNNHKLFSDPTDVLGPARPGISMVHIHPFISEEKIEQLTHDELKKMCFELIEGPILKAHPHLQEQSH